MSSGQNKGMYIDEKYALPYPQEFDRFWPHHALKAGIAVIITLVLLVGLSLVFTVPTNHDQPPLPSHGMHIPAPEWYLLFIFEPFWQFTGENAIWRQIGTFWIPLAVILFLFSIPFVFGRKPWNSQSRMAKGSRISLALGSFAVWVVLTSAVVGGGHNAASTSCISCHTPMAGKQIALPPLDMAKYYREVREIEQMLGRSRVGEDSAYPESYKDANWQLRHFREPTKNW